MKTVAMAIILLIAISISGNAVCPGRPDPFLIHATSGIDPVIDRISCDRNPRGIKVDRLDDITSNFRLSGTLSAPRSSSVKFGAWKMKTTTIYIPVPNRPDKYTTEDRACLRVEFQGSTKPDCAYYGGIEGWCPSDDHKPPVFHSVATAGFSLERRQTPIYQSGDMRLLGESSFTTVDLMGCFYISFGMMVDSYFGRTSTHFTNWSNMAWMVRNHCFNGAELIPATAARVLGMRYLGTAARSQESMRQVAEKNGRAIAHMHPTHFIFCFPLYGIKTDGEVLWDVFIETIRSRDTGYDLNSRGNPDVWNPTSTRIPRLTRYNWARVGKELQELRVFVADDPNQQVGPFTYRETINGWWRQRRTTSALSISTAEATQQEDMRLAGLRSLATTTAAYTWIESVETPIGILNTEGKLGDISLSTDSVPYAEGTPNENELYSEFFAGSQAPAGQYVFHVRGLPNAAYKIPLSGTDCSGQPMQHEQVGILDNEGKATFAYDYQPDTLPPAPWLVQSISELQSYPNDEVTFDGTLLLTEDNAFYCQLDGDAKGIRVEWPGGSSEMPGTIVSVTGHISSLDPEVIIEATNVEVTGGGLIPPPIMFPRGWSFNGPFCRLVKLAGKITADETGIKINNGSELLPVENLTPERASEIAGQTVILTGILRNGYVRYVGDDYQWLYEPPLATY